MIPKKRHTKHGRAVAGVDCKLLISYHKITIKTLSTMKRLLLSILVIATTLSSSAQNDIKKKILDKEYFEESLYWAEGGDVEAMLEVAEFYEALLL